MVLRAKLPKAKVVVRFGGGPHEYGLCSRKAEAERGPRFRRNLASILGGVCVQ